MSKPVRLLLAILGSCVTVPVGAIRDAVYLLTHGRRSGQRKP